MKIYFILLSKYADTRSPFSENTLNGMAQKANYDRKKKKGNFGQFKEIYSQVKTISQLPMKISAFKREGSHDAREISGRFTKVHYIVTQKA